VKRVKSPDGREWEVRASRIRLPPWRDNGFDPWDYARGPLDGLFAFLVLLPVFMVVVPLAVFVAELPIALVRGLFGSYGWIEAVTWHPQTMKITWRIDDRRDLREIFDRIAARLAEGYEGMEFEGACIVGMTPPAGLKDLPPNL
jgi:hypothetical protein